MVKILVLIMSSSNEPIYAEMKRISQIYYQLFATELTYFFMEFRDQEEEAVEDGTNLYLKGTESITPGLYLKTMKALQYVQSNYEYDFILRTNLSSFFNFRNVLTYLSEKPTANFAGGFTVFWFTSGTCIFFSRDVGEKLTSDIRYDDNTPDDVLISRLLDEKQIPRHNLSPFEMKYYINNYQENDVKNLTDDEIQKIIFYRCKNENSREYDLLTFRDLLQRVYYLEA